MSINEIIKKIIIPFQKQTFKLFIDNDLIEEALYENNIEFEDKLINEIIKTLMEKYKYTKYLYSEEELDSFGDGYIIIDFPEDGEPNDWQRWVYVEENENKEEPKSPMTQEDIEKLLNS